MEFHIAKRVREKYGFDAELFSYNGNVVLADFHAVRRFTEKLNRQRDLIHHPEQTVRAGEINALGLIDEIFHHVIQLYKDQKNPEIFTLIDQELSSALGDELYTSILRLFIANFPPEAVYQKQTTPDEYLSGFTDGRSNHENILEEAILLWLELQNPALAPYAELFEAPELAKSPRFNQVITQIRQIFTENPKFGPENQSLLEMLLSPSIAVPHSLPGQLEYIRAHWADFLGSYLYRLLTGLDLIKEENKFSFGGPGPVEVPVYRPGKGFGAGEAEAFSPDRDWMPRLVLIAKNTYVWLDQLSKQYEKEIKRLDQIPDEELRLLSTRGVTGLWLIGLWERSRASAKIKQLCGNPDAISSAYSLFSYEIAEELGGYEAYQKLSTQAWKFGIRLASDMVPNHMAIDSEWVNQHPEHFLSLDQSPYPSYSFNGPDLSSDPNITVQIEDHYFDRTDAAVVFRRIDKRNGDTRYIYHGNDGTSMPWNDTAQLDYLNPQVREAVIQTILDVAHKFPIIRFDAAMTLAKKHYQRLWFPEPGTGGDIPSRAEHSMTRQQFDQAMPVEFWREVVDRVAKEAPDTLLLAEAFWMMEGYFVRTLGMHRVYNSAFMNMLRNEDNAHYRQLLKNTLEFEPEILKRYVNFMNNPDERTAVDQFGKGDKYFGICTLMSTLPGLPMFGHGQFEGLTEKYGMEFRRAYLDEHPDDDLLKRHAAQISPLLHQRELFSGVDHFWLFDFYASSGSVDENIYTFFNRSGDKKAFVLYNNAYNPADGWIKSSVAQLVKKGGKKTLEQRDLAGCLCDTTKRADFLIFRDQMTGLQYLRPVHTIMDQGLHYKLNGYETHVLLDFRQVTPDPSHAYDRLYEMLGEGGVPDIDQAIGSLLIQPVTKASRALLEPLLLRSLVEAAFDPTLDTQAVSTEQLYPKIIDLLKGIAQVSSLSFKHDRQAVEILENLQWTLKFFQLEKTLNSKRTEKAQKLLAEISGTLQKDSPRSYVLILWGLLSNLGKLKDPEQFEQITISWMEEWQINHVILDTLSSLGFSREQAEKTVSELALAITQQRWYSTSKEKTIAEVIREWMSSPAIQNFLKVNRYDNKIWFDKSAFADFCWWMSALPVLESGKRSAEMLEALLGSQEILEKLKAVEVQSGYQLDKLVDLATQIEE